MTLSVWIARGLLTGLAIMLVFSWAQPTFGVQRGGAVVGREAHLFFLGLSTLCLLGLVYTLRLNDRRKYLIGVILLSAFSGVWFSIFLMMVKVMPIWLWLVLSELWFSLLRYFGHILVKLMCIITAISNKIKSLTAYQIRM